MQKVATKLSHQRKRSCSMTVFHPGDVLTIIQPTIKKTTVVNIESEDSSDKHASSDLPRKNSKEVDKDLDDVEDLKDVLEDDNNVGMEPVKASFEDQSMGKDKDKDKPGADFGTQLKTTNNRAACLCCSDGLVPTHVWPPSLEDNDTEGPCQHNFLVLTAC
jgi:hypothetical protein